MSMRLQRQKINAVLFIGFFHNRNVHYSQNQL